MAARSRAAKAGDAARAARSNPYIQRLIEDEDLRDNLRDAYTSVRDAYGRVSNGKAPARTLMDDKRVQRDIKQAAESLRDAGIALRQGPRRRRRARRGAGAFVLLVLVGGVTAVGLSSGLRKKVLDALFGAEEEFDYTSTTTPTPAAEAASV